ncbi:hypothetical protein BDR07DRAFT_1378927 [Suillus spraguei]|nr:hypothetical protein BDR07DRAFT_1378927 [Suillus spraguei]
MYGHLPPSNAPRMPSTPRHPGDSSSYKPGDEWSVDRPASQSKIHPLPSYKLHTPMSPDTIRDAFLPVSKWDDVIADHDVSTLIDFVSLPSDEEPLLKVLLEEVVDWLDFVCSSIDDLDANFLNLVTRTTDKRIYVSGYRFFINVSNEPIVSETAGREAFLEALKVGRGIRGAIYDLSYRMTTRQNDKDRSRSPFYRFLVTIHLRSDSLFDYPYSISLNFLMLKLCIRAIVVERARAYHEELYHSLIDETGYIFGLLLDQFRIVVPFSYSKAPSSLVQGNMPNNTLVVRGSELSATTVITMVESDSIVRESFGPGDSTKWPKDDLGCTDDGYCFLISSENPFAPAQLKEKVIETQRSIVLREKDRGIIYCTTIALIKELSVLLDIPYYTSSLDLRLDERANTEEKKKRF